MSWIKLDIGMPNNPKVLGISDKGFRIYIESICYAGSYMTDGIIPLAYVKKNLAEDVIDELVTRNLWKVTGEKIEIVNYMEHQTPKDEIEKKRESGRKRQERYREKNGTPKRIDALEVIEKYGSDCHICGKPIDLNISRDPKNVGSKNSLQIDHVIPRTKGGSDEIENLRPAHAFCNKRKSDAFVTRLEEEIEEEVEIEIEDIKKKNGKPNGLAINELVKLYFDNFSGSLKPSGNQVASHIKTALKQISYEEITDLIISVAEDGQMLTLNTLIYAQNKSKIRQPKGLAVLQAMRDTQ